MATSHHLNWETSAVSENRTWGRLEPVRDPAPPTRGLWVPAPREGGTSMLPGSACGHVQSHKEGAVLDGRPLAGSSPTPDRPQ